MGAGKERYNEGEILVDQPGVTGGFEFELQQEKHKSGRGFWVRINNKYKHLRKQFFTPKRQRCCGHNYNLDYGNEHNTHSHKQSDWFIRYDLDNQRASFLPYF